MEETDKITDKREIMKKLRTGKISVELCGYTISGTSTFDICTFLKSMKEHGSIEAEDKYKALLVYCLLTSHNPLETSMINQKKAINEMIKWMNALRTRIGDEEIKLRLEESAIMKNEGVIFEMILYAWKKKLHLGNDFLDVCMFLYPRLIIRDNARQFFEANLQDIDGGVQAMSIKENVQYRKKTSLDKIEAFIQKTLFLTLREARKKNIASERLESFYAKEWRNCKENFIGGDQNLRKECLLSCMKTLQNIIIYLPSRIEMAEILMSYLTDQISSSFLMGEYDSTWQ